VPRIKFDCAGVSAEKDGCKPRVVHETTSEVAGAFCYSENGKDIEYQRFDIKIMVCVVWLILSSTNVPEILNTASGLYKNLHFQSDGVLHQKWLVLSVTRKMVKILSIRALILT
jgi:hypothetical protein